MYHDVSYNTPSFWDSFLTFLTLCYPPPAFQAAYLYRKSLKTCLSWAVDRDIFNDKATEIRSRFDANRGVSTAAAVRLLKVR
jgi:hypothetical protein